MRMERENIEEFTYDGIRDFIHISCEGQGVADMAILKGHVTSEDKIYYHNYIALSCLDIFAMHRRKFNVVFNKKSDNLIEIYDRVLALKIPGGIAEALAGVDTNQDIYYDSKSYLVSECMPYVVVGLGETEAADEEVAVLFYVKGVSPKDALAEVQQAVFAHKIRFN